MGAALISLLAFGSFTWSGSVHASGSGGGGTWFATAQGYGDGFNDYAEAAALTIDDTPLIAGRLNGDIFVAALNSDDSTFAWSVRTQARNGGWGDIYAITVTNDDTPIVGGYIAESISFPTGRPAPDDSITLTSTGYEELPFVAAMNADDSTFAWAVQATGARPGYDWGYVRSVAVTADDTPVLTGYFEGALSFPTGRPAPDDSITLTSAGQEDIFVASLNADDSTFAWAINVGGFSADYGYSIAMTTDDTPIMTGAFAGTVTFPTGLPAPDDSITLTAQSGGETFVAALNVDDSTFAWAIPIGSTDSVYESAIVINSQGEPLMTGNFVDSASFPTGLPAPDDSITITEPDGDAKPFVAQMNADDSTFSWAVPVGGAADAFGIDIAVTADDTTLITGFFYGTLAFATGRPAPDDSITLTTSGSKDIFVAGLNADDSNFAWAVRAGGTGSDQGQAIVARANGTPVATGRFSGAASFPTGPSTSIGLTSAGGEDVFVASLGAAAAAPIPTVTAVSPSGGPDSGGTSVTITGTNLAGATSVTFGGVAGTITGNSVTQVIATAPAHAAGAVDVSVTTSAGTGTSPGAFTYTATPTPPAPAPPATTPSAPLDVAGLPGDASATIAWSAPQSTGSFPISAYRVESSPGNGSCLVQAPATDCTVTELTSGVPYRFRVSALNGAGWGQWSDWSETVTPRPTPVPAIMITGYRDGRTVNADGVTQHLTTTEVITRVKLRGQKSYRTGVPRTIGADGAFTWQRTTVKKTYVYFTADGIRSNRVIIAART